VALMRGRGLRGRHPWALLEDIAAGTMSYVQMAEKHDVPIKRSRGLFIHV
jgi:hypothetical protein